MVMVTPFLLPSIMATVCVWVFVDMLRDTIKEIRTFLEGGGDPSAADRDD